MDIVWIRWEEPRCLGPKASLPSRLCICIVYYIDEAERERERERERVRERERRREEEKERERERASERARERFALSPPASHVLTHKTHTPKAIRPRIIARIGSGGKRA